MKILCGLSVLVIAAGFMGLTLTFLAAVVDGKWEGFDRLTKGLWEWGVLVVIVSGLLAGAVVGFRYFNGE